jgi:hypothetical protein
MRVLTDNGPDSLYVTLFDFSNAAPKFNHLNRLTFGRDAGWFVIPFLLLFLALTSLGTFACSITEVAIGDGDDSVEAWKARSQAMQPTWAEMFRVGDYIYF